MTVINYTKSTRNTKLIDSGDETYKQNEPKVSANEVVKRKNEYAYYMIAFFTYGYIAAAYGTYLVFTSAKWQTSVYAQLLGHLGGIGITAGAHRLWTHKAYKAKMPLQVILLILNSTVYQGSIRRWVRDHRTHHKHSDTEADPHNANRGFFFSHLGCNLVRKNAEVREKMKDIDMSDIESNPLLRFQDKYKVWFAVIFAFIIPAAIPMYFWGETFSNAWHIGVMYRYMLLLNITFLVNSVAHFWGYKPYDNGIRPAENIMVTIATLGEGFHNYHHVFPWDYRTAELGNNKFSPTTWFIDFFAKIGWAYDLKTVPEDMAARRVARTGDGSEPIWGWGDKDQTQDEINAAVIINPINKDLELRNIRPLA